MTPEFRTLPEKKLIGMHIVTSIAADKTAELWRNFMPRRNEIVNAAGADLFSLQVYPAGFDFQNFDINRDFEKWALREVNDFNSVPGGMETFIIPGGLYAVFLYKGSNDPQSAAKLFGWIFNAWLPQSGYVIDNRPHFEILGAKYKNGSPDSEEEVWIPVKQRRL